MSWAGLFHPFSTKTDDDSGLLPCFTPPDSGVLGESAIDTLSYNPFRGAGNHDIEIMTSLDEYDGIKAYHGNYAEESARGVALRGPLLVAGYGYGLFDGLGYPSGDGGALHENAPRRSDLWKVGSVDLLWDQYRGVWSSRDIVTATAPSGITAGGYNTCWVGGHSGWPLQVSNIFSRDVPTGVTVIAGYALNLGIWQVIAADCPPSG